MRNVRDKRQPATTGEPAKGEEVEVISEVVMYISLAASKQTKIIAQSAFREGFDGIVYTTVRTSSDVATPDM